MYFLFSEAKRAALEVRSFHGFKDLLCSCILCLEQMDCYRAVSLVSPAATFPCPSSCLRSWVSWVILPDSPSLEESILSSWCPLWQPRVKTP